MCDVLLRYLWPLPTLVCLQCSTIDQVAGRLERTVCQSVPDLLLLDGQGKLTGFSSFVVCLVVRLAKWSGSGGCTVTLVREEATGDWTDQIHASVEALWTEDAVFIKFGFQHPHRSGFGGFLFSLLWFGQSTGESDCHDVSHYYF